MLLGRFWLLLSVLCLPLPAISGKTQEPKVYVSLDAMGHAVFSDTISQDAVLLTLSRPSTLAVANLPEPQPAQATTEHYEITIVTPEHQATLRSNIGEVLIIAQVSPSLPENAKIQLLLNNKPQGELAHNQLLLHNLDRGEHHIQLALFTQNGKLIATSPATIFYLHRASIISPN